MFLIERLNVYEPIAWLLKAIIRHRILFLDFFASEFASPGGVGGAFVQRRATVILHLVNSFLLYGFTLKLLTLRRNIMKQNSNMIYQCDIIGSLVGSAIWAIHPLRTEVIGWPSAQPYTLATMFMLLGIHAHLKLWEHENSTSYQRNKTRFFSLIFFMFGFLSKSAMLPFPSTLVAIALGLSPPVWMIDQKNKRRQRQISPVWVKHWKSAGYELVLPFISFIIGIVATLLANTKGVLKDADVHWLSLYQRIHKAVSYFDISTHSNVYIYICILYNHLPSPLSTSSPSQDAYYVDVWWEDHISFRFTTTL